MKASGSQNPSVGALRTEPALSPGVLDHLPDGIVICQQAEDDLTIDYVNGPFGHLLSLRARPGDSLGSLLGDRLEAQSREILRAGLTTRQGISILLRGSAEHSNIRLRLALRPLEDGPGWIGSLVRLPMTAARDDGGLDLAGGPLLQRIVDASPGFVGMKDTDGRYVLVNSSFAELLGLEPSQFVGRTGAEVLQLLPRSAEIRPALAQLVAGEQDIIKTRQPMIVRDIRVVDATGRERWIDALRTPLMDAHGVIRYILGVGTDQTQQRRRDSELHLQAEQLQKVVALKEQAEEVASRLPGAIFRWESVADTHRLVYLSEGIERLTGLSSAALIKDPHRFWRLAPDDAEARFKRAVRRAIAGRRSLVVELPIQHAQSGEQRWLRFSASRHQDAADIVRFDGQIVDITAERHSENALLAVRNQLHSITSSVPGVVFQLQCSRDLSRRSFLFVSEGSRSLLGVAPQELLADQSLLEARVLTEDRPEVTNALWRAVDSMRPWQAEFRIRDADGCVKWVRALATPAEDATDDHVIYNGILTDATDTHRAASQLASAEQRFQEFTRFMPGAVFQAELETDGARCTYISEGGSDILGLDQATILADYPTVRRLVHAEDRDELQAALQRAAARLERLDHEFRIHHPQGETRWLRVSCGFRAGAAGVVLVEGQIGDITAQKQVERALADARSELRQLSRTIPGGIYQLAFGPRFEARYLYMSESWEDLFGFDAERTKRDPHAFVAILNKDDRDRNQPIMERAVRAFEPYDVQYRATTPAGVRWIRAVARPVRRMGEEVIYSAVAVDVTELKGALTQLESSQRQLQQLTATLPGAVFQVTVDAASNGAVLTYVSSGIQDIFGVPAAELLGPVEKALSFIPDRDPAELRDRLRQMAQRREPMELERQIVSATDETRWLRFTARPVSGADGAILYNGVVMDITAARTAASRLADSEQRLELALQNGKLGLVDWHVPSGRVHYNRQFAEIMGTSKEDLGEQAARLDEFQLPADRKRVAKAWQAHLEGRTVEFSCEYRIIRSDGQQRWLQALGRMVERGADGAPLRYVGTVQDVTDRVQAERQLEQQVVFSRLITKLSSEFVNPSSGGVDRAIGEALALVGGFSGVDLAYLSENGAQTLVRTQVWDARGADGRAPPRSFSWSDVPWLRRRVLARHLVYLPDLGSLPADAQADHQALQAAGVQGLVVVPLYMGNESLGALVLQTNSASKQWSRGNLSLLRIVGEIISQALDRKRSEAALAAAESTVREVTRALPGIIYQLYRDPTGTLDWRFVRGTLMDQMTATDTGGQPMPLLEAVDQRDLPGLQAALSASAVSSGHLEHDVRLGSGMRWARLYAYPRKLPEGGTLFNGIAIDITDTKLAEAALQASEERFRELYNTTPVMMHGVDGSGRIVSVNEHWLTTLGYARHEVVGRRAEEFMNAASGAHVDRGAKQLEAPGHPREKLLQMVAKSGKTIDVMVSTRAEVDNAGRLRGAKSSMVDVTERNRALRALEESEMRYRAVVQDQTEIIARFNAHGRIDFVNDACLRFLGQPADEVLGGNWLDFMDRSTEGSLDRGLQGLSPAAPVGHWEVRHVNPLGRFMWCQWTVRAFYDRAGALAGYQAVGRDVTEIRKLEREIREISQREQERIGHDLHDGLGQELTGLSLMLKTLETDVQAQASSLLPEVRALADTLNHSIATARSLAQGLSPVKLDHEGLVGALEHLVEHATNVYGVPVRLDAPRAVELHDPTMATDLYRIVQEAVTNAVRHGDPDSVLVSVKDEDGVLTLDISDDGTGISGKASDSNGMGLRIMRYRANIIGAALEVGPGGEGGTLVRCTLRRSHVPEQLKTA